MFAVLPPGRLHGGARDVLLRLTDDTGRITDVPYRLVGPEPEEDR